MTLMIIHTELAVLAEKLGLYIWIIRRFTFENRRF